MGDVTVFFMGKYFGKRLLKHKRFNDWISPEGWNKIIVRASKWGPWAGGVFRFTPGIRFPGFFACGMLGTPFLAFFTADALAALISIPTQVLLISKYGDVILDGMKKGKWYAFVVLATAAVIFVGIQWRRHHKSRKASLSKTSSESGVKLG